MTWFDGRQEGDDDRQEASSNIMFHVKVQTLTDNESLKLSLFVLSVSGRCYSHTHRRKCRCSAGNEQMITRLFLLFLFLLLLLFLPHWDTFSMFSPLCPNIQDKIISGNEIIWSQLYFLSLPENSLRVIICFLPRELCNASDCKRAVNSVEEIRDNTREEIPFLIKR